jgi:hypothetical protein
MGKFMTYNGHLVHPDIWMLWFSFFVALVQVAWGAIRLWEWVLDKWLDPSVESKHEKFDA